METWWSWILKKLVFFFWRKKWKCSSIENKLVSVFYVKRGFWKRVWSLSRLEENEVLEVCSLCLRLVTGIGLLRRYICSFIRWLQTHGTRLGCQEDHQEARLQLYPLGRVWYRWEVILVEVWGNQHRFVVLLGWSPHMAVYRGLDLWHMRHHWMLLAA